MFRITKLSGKYYAKEFSHIEDDEELEDIMTLIESGTIVTLCEDLEDFRDEACVEEEIIIV